MGIYVIMVYYCPEDCVYAPNFEKVEGAYCFGLVRPSVSPSVQNLRYGFEIS